LRNGSTTKRDGVEALQGLTAKDRGREGESGIGVQLILELQSGGGGKKGGEEGGHGAWRRNEAIIIPVGEAKVAESGHVTTLHQV